MQIGLPGSTPDLNSKYTKSTHTKKTLKNNNNNKNPKKTKKKNPTTTKKKPKPNKQPPNFDV